MLPVGAAVANAVSAPPAAAGTAVRAVLHADVPHSLQPPQPHTTHGTSSSGPARLLLGQNTPSTSTELAASALPARGSTAATPAGAAAAPGPPAGTTAAAAAAVLPASDTAAVAAAASGPPAGATATTAAVLPAGSDSTGSLTEDADADADKFSWHVQRRAPDVNMFSWVAAAPSPAGSTTPAAAPGPSAGATAAAAVLPASATSAAAAVHPAGSDSTGSLTADADADEFSWHVEHRAPDVNTFSWVAAAPSPAGSTTPAAASGPPADTTAAAAVLPASDTAAVLPAGATSAAAAVHPAGSDSTGSLTADADAYEFSWHVEHRAPDVNTFSWVATAPNQSGRTRQHKQSSGSLGYVSSTASAVASTPVPSSSSVGKGEEQQGLLPAIEEGNAVSLGTQTARSDGASKAGVLASAAKAPAAAPAVVRGAAAAAVPAAAGQAGQLMPHVLVSYGSGDWESRLAVLTLQEVDDMFEPSQRKV
jgi:solute carrier family 6 amino acid transporter-like protein 5/7/9/14